MPDYQILGVDRASRLDTRLVVNAESPENARAKAELAGVVVTSIVEFDRVFGVTVNPATPVEATRPASTTAPPPALSPQAPLAICASCRSEIPASAQKCRYCGSLQRQTPKSDVTAFVLGLLLGPVGLWYKGQWPAGFAWFVMTIAASLATGGCAAPVCWLGMAVHAAVARSR